MDKKVAGLLGAMGALAATSQAQAMVAAPAPEGSTLRASSYADLLKPIPDALALLRAQPATSAGLVQEAQVLVPVPDRRYHHHHHRRYRRRPPHHHHHHHHHNQS